MRSINRSFYKSAAWLKTRDSYMKSQGGLCERCRKDGILTPAEIVHHKIYLTEDNYKDPSVSLNWDNLEALCLDCHNREHFGEQTDRRWKYVDGKLVIIR